MTARTAARKTDEIHSTQVLRHACLQCTHRLAQQERQSVTRGPEPDPNESKQDSVRAGSEVSLGIRPELFKAVATDAVPSGMNALDGRIAGRTFAGNLLHVYVDID